MNNDIVFGSQHIHAIRIFRVNMQTLELESVNPGREIYTPGKTMRSYCGRAKAHGFTKPEKNCDCGIWACKSRKDLAIAYPPSLWLDRTDIWGNYRRFGLSDMLVSAQVELWGKVIEHEKGYRAEFARIIPDTIQIYPRVGHSRKKKLIKFLRQKYLGN